MQVGTCSDGLGSQRRTLISALLSLSPIHASSSRLDLTQHTFSIHSLCQAEALIDFGDGQDIVKNAYTRKVLNNQPIYYLQTIQFLPARPHAITQIQKHLSDDRREVVRSGIKMAIFGPPDAGKSSLSSIF
jgi:tRNA U34 5-carboxymethylaminomethyl modifying GTPase MnmE/TrmE